MAYCSKCGADMGGNKPCSCGTPVQPAEKVPVGEAPQAPVSAPVPAAPPVAQALTEPSRVAPIMPTPRVFGAKWRDPASVKVLVWGIGGSAFMLVGAMGSTQPWAAESFMEMSKSAGGLSGDGVITIVTTLLALVFFVIGATVVVRWPFIVSLVLCLVTAGVGIYNATAVSPQLLVGTGLWMVIVSGAVGILASIGGIASPRNQS
ncbi:MAG: hypothetical protein ACYC99_04225 [Candidatus Geothermincolia bacterium]